jgi:hypothetical protein
MAMGLELIPMISASTPYFLSSPFSWITHIGLAAGLSAAQAILVFFLRSGGKEWKDQDGRANDSRDLFHCVTHGVYLPMAGNLIL